MDDKKAVFISYAWGGTLDTSDAVRSGILNALSPDFSVFWDRRSISHGESADEAVAKALRKRPIDIFCVCDEEYLAAASTVDSGVYRELGELTRIVASEDVRVIPVILDRECLSKLPEPLRGRVPLDVSEMHVRGLPFGHAMWAIASGASQEEMDQLMSDDLRHANVRAMAMEYFRNVPTRLFGNGRTHVVEVGEGRNLLPPQWMLERTEWQRRLLEESEDFWPMKGIWQWHWGTASTGLCALGISACAAFFPNEAVPDNLRAIERAGVLLAEGFFSFIDKREAFIFEHEDLVNTLMSKGGIDILERLVSSANSTRQKIC
ncbi:TIR domain-containing protein [Paraburkholderia sp. 32]|uniref:TIR domain-containing protein n=1 Tax=Paraburkholderia sp. 32 TaxID=2991057 RepID=UPI003D1D7C02